jgi:DNA-binding LytR/AlgR family response regulator
MGKIRIAIADDDTRFLSEIVEMVQCLFNGTEEETEIKQFVTGRALMTELDAETSYDIYLLDVEMPGADGVQLAEKIRKYDQNAYIVFITSFEKYAIKGYQHHIYHYVMKEEYQEKLPGILLEIQKKIEEGTKRYYKIESERKHQKIRWDNIVYVEKEKNKGKYVKFHCNNGNDYEERETLQNVYSKLPEREFAYTYRSQIVNLRYVEEEVRGVIKITGMMEPITISAQLLPEFRRKLGEYWRKL